MWRQRRKKWGKPRREEWRVSPNSIRQEEGLGGQRRQESDYPWIGGGVGGGGSLETPMQECTVETSHPEMTPWDEPGFQATARSSITRPHGESPRTHPTIQGPLIWHPSPFNCHSRTKTTFTQPVLISHSSSVPRRHLEQGIHEYRATAPAGPTGIWVLHPSTL